MSIVLQFVKDLIRPLMAKIRKRYLKGKLLASLDNAKSGYNFTEEDVELYVEERFVALPTSVTEKTRDPELVEVTINGKNIFWPAGLSGRDLPWLYHEIFDDFTTNPSSYDHPELSFKNRKWIIDAGAAEGYYSIFALEKTFGRLISIEPLPLMKTALMRTLSSYPNGENAIVVSAALGDKPGWSEIQVDYEHVCDSRLVPHTIEFALIASNPVTQRVPITTLDQLATQYSLGGDGLIKMDIEGYEMAALSGAVNLMKNYKPALAIAVYHEFENALKCADIIKAANSSYKIGFRGCYGYFDPPRPYMVFAY